MVRLRLDRRLRGRLDSSDVLQDAYLEVARRAGEYLAAAQHAAVPVASIPDEPGAAKFAPPSFEGTNARCRTGSVTPAARDPAGEFGLLGGDAPGPAHLANPCGTAVEMQVKLQEILNAMEPLDREVLALRHFEELSNQEVAAGIGALQDSRQ